MATEFGEPLHSSEDDRESAWSEEESTSSAGGGRSSRKRGRLGRSVTPRLVLGLALLLILAAAVWWGVQTVLLPPVPTATPTSIATLAISPPATRATTAVPIIPAVTAQPTSPLDPPADSVGVGEHVIVYGTGVEGIRFRSGPGTDYTTLAILKDGGKLLVVGGPEEADGFTWWRLESEDGTVGWAAEAWLQLDLRSE